MPNNIAPVAQNLETSQAKPASAKKEFIKLLRDIKGIVAKSRAFSADFINASQFDMEQQSTNQRYGGYVQIGAIALGAAKNLPKLGEFAQLGVQAYLSDVQSVQQRLQQNMTFQNTFEQRSQTLIQTITNFEQQERQKELEQAQFNH